MRLRIVQARSPQAKSVERTFFEHQKRASLLPGFAGFNQRNEKSKALQDFDRRVSVGLEHPGNEYLHVSDLRKNYEQISLEFANRECKGVRHRGRTPLDYWNESVSRKALRKLPAEIEHLFATRRIPSVKVHSFGIKIALNSCEDAFYFDGNTGPLVDDHVPVYINYEIPEFIHIEHPETHKLLKIERDFTRRRTATPQEMAKSNAARKAHVAGARGEAGNINIDGMVKSWVVREHEYSPLDMKNGAIIAAATEEHQETKPDKTRSNPEFHKMVADRGDNVALIRDPSRYKASVERERLIREQLAMQSDSGLPDPPITTL